MCEPELCCARLLAQTTLRNILGTKDLHQILSDRENISGSMQVTLYYLKSTTFIKPNNTTERSARQFWMKPRATGGSKWRGSRCKYW